MRLLPKHQAQTEASARNLRAEAMAEDALSRAEKARDEARSVIEDCERQKVEARNELSEFRRWKEADKAALTAEVERLEQRKKEALKPLLEEKRLLDTEKARLDAVKTDLEATKGVLEAQRDDLKRKERELSGSALELERKGARLDDLINSAKENSAEIAKREKELKKKEIDFGIYKDKQAVQLKTQREEIEKAKKDLETDRKLSQLELKRIDDGRRAIASDRAKLAEAINLAKRYDTSQKG